MTNGVREIAIERDDQIREHLFSIDNDVKNHKGRELLIAAIKVVSLGDFASFPIDMQRVLNELDTGSISDDFYLKVMKKPYKHRLIIAGALIAAEIDRISELEK